MAEKISYCVDSESRLTSLSPYDMSGNTDWYCTTVDALGLTMDDALWDDHGACLYKVEDGAAVLRSEEERRADWPEPEPEPEHQPTVEELQAKVSEQAEEIDMLTECILEMSEIIYGE